ncbi:RNA polymerase sigma factor [Actinomadura formosensis]|uniref:RNA polymerase sigma factor n=1 Tax=Actinomadura formosensis TaxID=60706 RepID=UPI003D90C10E
MLFDRYAARLHRYAGRRLGDGEADDIVAETFSVAFRQRDAYDLNRPDALPWLYGSASNVIRRHRRIEVAATGRSSARGRCQTRPPASRNGRSSG